MALEWFSPQGLLQSLSAELARPVRGRQPVRLFAVEGGRTLVMIDLVEELVRRQAAGAGGDLALQLEERPRRIEVLREAVAMLDALGAVERRWLREGYFYGGFNLLRGDYVVPKTYHYLPLRTEAIAPELGAGTTRPPLTGVTGVLPHFESPYDGRFAPRLAALPPVRLPLPPELAGLGALDLTALMAHFLPRLNVIEEGGMTPKFRAFTQSSGLVYLAPALVVEAAAAQLGDFDPRLCGPLWRYLGRATGLVPSGQVNESGFGCFSVMWSGGGQSSRKYPFFPLDGRRLLENFAEVDAARPARLRRLVAVSLYC